MKMKVYPISNSFGLNEIICGTAIDAEEMILSLVEEALYDNYYSYEQIDSLYSGRSFWESTARYKLSTIKEDGNKYETVEGLALNLSCDYDYQECDVI